MKKIIFTIITLILGITFVNASSCVITSGTGKNVGDEISCGSEQFYVISNDGENVKMLGKYNLMVGSSYYYLEIDDYETKNLNYMYQHPEVKKKLEEGYYVSYYTYTYNANTSLYTVTGVSFFDDYVYDNITVVFDSGYSTIKEAHTNTEVKKYLEMGYQIYNTVYVDSKYIAVKLNKYALEDNKTIFFDGTTRSLGDILRKNEVKTLLDQGYRIRSKYYTNTTSSTTSVEYLYDFYAITFTKYQYYEEVNIIFDENLTSKTDYNNYVNNNTKIQELKAAGYEIDNYDGGKWIWNQTTNTYDYTYYGIRLYKYNEENDFSNVYQDEKAIGIQGEVGKPEYPFYGIIYSDSELVESYHSEYNDGDVYGGYYQDVNLDEYTYFEWYERTLLEAGYPVKNVSTLSVSELNDVVKSLAGLELPLQDWYENKTYIEEADVYLVGSIKEFLNGKHEWLWSTAYWLRTKPFNTWQYLFDINTLGDLCSSDLCDSDPTTGVRPVVTISASDIVYGVKTQTDGNGTVEATHVEAKSGEEVKFTIEPKKGYVLKEIKVTDEEGNVVIFTENTFVMPSANVTIEASFTKVINPNTTSISILAGLIFAIVSITIIKLNYSKLRWINE